MLVTTLLIILNIFNLFNIENRKTLYSQEEHIFTCTLANKYTRLDGWVTCRDYSWNYYTFFPARSAWTERNLPVPGTKIKIVYVTGYGDDGRYYWKRIYF